MTLNILTILNFRIKTSSAPVNRSLLNELKIETNLTTLIYWARRLLGENQQVR